MMIRPRTRQEQRTLQVKGDIRGWFKLPRGRPPKKQLSSTEKENTAPQAPLLLNAPPVKEGEGKKLPKKARGKYQKWTKGEHSEQVSSYLNGDTTFLEPVIEWSTLYSLKKKN